MPGEPFGPPGIVYISGGAIPDGALFNPNRPECFVILLQIMNEKICYVMRSGLPPMSGTTVVYTLKFILHTRRVKWRADINSFGASEKLLRKPRQLLL